MRQQPTCTPRTWHLISGGARNEQPPLIKRQSPVTFSARGAIGSSEERNKWQGPAAGGKDAVYAGYDLEPIAPRAFGRATALRGAGLWWVG